MWGEGGEGGWLCQFRRENPPLSLHTAVGQVWGGHWRGHWRGQPPLTELQPTILLLYAGLLITDILLLLVLLLFLAVQLEILEVLDVPAGVRRAVPPSVLHPEESPALPGAEVVGVPERLQVQDGGSLLTPGVLLELPHRPGAAAEGGGQEVAGGAGPPLPPPPGRPGRHRGHRDLQASLFGRRVETSLQENQQGVAASLPTRQFLLRHVVQ